jgi:hypothetical protein
MSDAVLQILLLLAYSAIGLISVTFPIYAICATYLKEEKWESEKERKKRMEKLRAGISELTAQLKGEEPDSERVTELKDKLEKYESELEGIELGVKYLTAEGAVRNPIIKLVLALVAAGVGMHFFYEGAQQNVILFGCASAILSALALLNLYKTISAVEYAALRPARTIEFFVKYTKGKETKQVKVGKKAELRVFAGTNEHDVEKCVMYVQVPSELGIPETSLRKSVFSDHTMIVAERDFLPKKFAFGSGFSIVPKNVGKYSINVTICARGIYENKKQLFVDVVK